MVRSLILGVVLVTLLGGCATAGRGGISPPETAKVRHVEKSSWGDQLAAAHGTVDRFADGVGRVLYPPLFVAAFPLWVLSGFGGTGR